MPSVTDDPPPRADEGTPRERLRRFAGAIGPHAVVLPFLVLHVADGVGDPSLKVPFGAAAVVLAALGLVALPRDWRPSRGVAAYTALAGAALGTWVLTYQLTQAPVLVPVSLLSASLVLVLVGRGHVEAVLVPLVLGAVALAPSPSPAVVVVYLVAAAAVWWARGTPDARRALPLAVAALAWVQGWSGVAFYAGTRLDLLPRIVQHPAVAPAVPEEAMRELYGDRVRWLAESCDGSYLVAGSLGGLWWGPRSGETISGESMRQASVEHDGQPLRLHLIDTVLHDCDRDRVVLIHEKPRPGLLLLEGAWPPSVRLVPTEAVGSVYRAWIADEPDRFWLYGQFEGLKRAALLVDDAGRVLQERPIGRDFHCWLPVGEGDAGGERLIFGNERVHRVSGVGAHLDAAPPLVDPFVSTCAYLEDRRLLVTPGFLRSDLWWQPLDARGGDEPIGRGLRTVFDVPGDQRVLAFNYLSGDLLVLDSVSRRERRRVNVGARARRASFSADYRRAYVTTRSGAFVIDVDALLSEGD